MVKWIFKRCEIKNHKWDQIGHKKKPNLQVEKLVVLKDKTLPTLLWAWRRIVITYPEKDKVCLVTMKTLKGTLKRNVTLICPFPMEIESWKFFKRFQAGWLCVNLSLKCK